MGRPVPPASQPYVQGHLADLRSQVAEPRELLVELMQNQGLDRAGARGGPVLLGEEEKIPLSEAVAMIWGRAVSRNPESVETHAALLKGWVTKGLKGAVLETVVARNKWYTRRQAVERFMAQTFGGFG